MKKQTHEFCRAFLNREIEHRYGDTVLVGTIVQPVDLSERLRELSRKINLAEVYVV
jgi:hypothetical protein